jgi:polyhydroxybutyrate depolymerase
VATLTACSGGDPLANRPFDVHVPPSYHQGTPAPLLVVLHGYANDGAVTSGYLRALSVADSNGMLLVAPNGTVDPQGKRFWNATDACCGPEGASVDDSAYLAAVIEKIESSYDVDPKRVFLLGHSNGGFMAYRMACDHADLVAAVASFEGAMTNDVSQCDPSEPVSVLAIHGTADDVIRYDGGASPTTSARYPSVQTSTKDWARFDHCDARPTRGDPATRSIIDGLPPALVQTYPGCDKGTAVEVWTQPRGDHMPSVGASFTQQVVQFFLAHPKR